MAYFPYDRKQKIVRRLNAAARYMEKNGYCKGSEEDDRGRVCAYGALVMVTEGDNDYLLNDVAYAFSDYLRKTRAKRCKSMSEYSSTQGSIFGYNDAPARRGKDVVKALRDCAEKLRTGKLED